MCERNIDWFPLACPQTWTWPPTQAWALSGNQTSNPLVHRPAPNLQSNASQGCLFIDIKFKSSWLRDQQTVAGGPNPACLYLTACELRMFTF